MVCGIGNGIYVLCCRGGLEWGKLFVYDIGGLLLLLVDLGYNIY